MLPSRSARPAREPASRRARLARCPALCLVWFLTLHALAQSPARPSTTIPPGAVLWWTWDPTSIAPPAGPDSALPDVFASRLSTSLLRAAAASGLIYDKPAADALRATLAAAELLAIPHTLCVLRLEDLPPDRTSPLGSIRLDAVIDLATASTDTHRRLIQTIQAILAPRDAPNPGSQRTLTIRSGLSAVAFRRPDSPPHTELAWCSSPGHFTIALGPGVLERWVALRDSPPATPHPAPRADIAAQLMHIRQLRPAAVPLFQFGLDCTQLRTTLANARSFILHAGVIPPPDVRTSLAISDLAAFPASPTPIAQTYFGPPLVVIDATWSARSLPPTSIGHAPISEPYWPADQLPFPPPRPLFDVPAQPPTTNPLSPRAAFVAVFRINPTRASLALDSLAGFYSGLLDRRRGLAFERDFDAWARSSRSTRDRLLHRLGPYAILLGPPTPATSHSFPLNGVSLVVPLDPATNPDAFDRDLSSLLTPLKSHIRRHHNSPIRTLTAPHLGVIDLAAWATLPHSLALPNDPPPAARRFPPRPWCLASAAVGLTDSSLHDRIQALTRWVQSTTR